VKVNGPISLNGQTQHRVQVRFRFLRDADGTLTLSRPRSPADSAALPPTVLFRGHSGWPFALLYGGNYCPGVMTRVTAHIMVMILPQVHLRKPCYDFYFL
jgi:hypothetical protein